MLIRLTKKLANIVNGIDLSKCAEGDVIELPPRYAQLLIADRWAEALPASPNRPNGRRQSLRAS